MVEITKQVTVTISNDELLCFFVDAIAKPAHGAEGPEVTLYRALGHLPGKWDTEAVLYANRLARDEKLPTITTDEFRKWLPIVFSRFAAAVMGE